MFMNKQIRLGVFDLFEQGIIDMDESELAIQIQRSLKKAGQVVEPVDIVRTISYMKDAGELIPVEGYGGLRLTLKAIETQKPWHFFVGRYFGRNWIAITALIISIIAILIG